MAISRTQAQSAVHTSSLVSSLGVVMATAVAAGDLLVCFVWVDNTSDTITVADNINGSWTSGISQQNNTAFAMQMFYKQNSSAAAANAMTVTATIASTTAHIAMQVVDYAGAATSSALDGTPVAKITTTSGTTITSPSLTTTGASDVLVACMGGATAFTSPVAGSGYTIPTNGSTTRTAQEDQLNVAASSYTASISWTTSLAATIILAAFLPAGGAATIREQTLYMRGGFGYR